MKVSGKSHSTENPKGSSMLAKRFVSSTNRGGSNKKVLNKRRKISKPKIVKGGPVGLFENSIYCKISKKIEGVTFRDNKKFRKSQS